MKYLLGLREKMQTFIKSDMLYAALPVWFLVYAITLLSSLLLPIEVIYTAFQDGITEVVISNVVLSIICWVISYIISPINLFVGLSNNEDDISSKKEYVFVGRVFVAFIWIVSALIYLISKHMADMGTL